MRVSRSPLCVLFCLLLSLTAFAQEPPRPRDRAEWLTRLRSLHAPLTRDDYLSLNQFQALDATTSYGIIREAWSEISSEDAKIHLVSYVAFEAKKARLFNLLHLGVTDKSPLIKSFALRYLRRLIFLDLSDDAAYQAWYRENESLTVSEVVRKSAQKYAALLRQAPDAQKVRALGSLLEFQFSPFRDLSEVSLPLGTLGIMGLRNNAVIEGGFIPLLFDLLAPDISRPVRRKALLCIAHLGLSVNTLRKREALIRPLAADLIQNTEAAFSERFALLASFRSDWALDLLLELATQGLGERNFDEIVQGLFAMGSGRVAPMLIALMDYPDLMPETPANSSVAAYLSRLFEAPGGEWTASQWRKWWYNNQNDYDARFTNQPFPRLEVSVQSDKTVYRRVRLPIYLDRETKPAYQFISSGLIRDNKSAASMRLPGLIVALESSEKSPITIAGRWQETLEEVAHGGYVVALISERDALPERVREIVQDVMSHIPIDPKRVFLNGNGTLGRVAYTCSLERNTPFKGFWMKDAPFTLEGLPAMKSAQNRRYYVQNEPKSAMPYLQSLAAKSRLGRAGAKVHLERAETALAASQLRAALAWLEGER